MVLKIVLITLFLCCRQASAGCMYDVLTKTEEVVSTEDPISDRSMQLYGEIAAAYQNCNETILSWDDFYIKVDILLNFEAFISRIFKSTDKLVQKLITLIKTTIHAYVDAIVDTYLAPPIKEVSTGINSVYTDNLSGSISSAQTALKSAFSYMELLPKGYLPVFVKVRIEKEKEAARILAEQQKQEELKRLAAIAATSTTPAPAKGGGFLFG